MTSLWQRIKGLRHRTTGQPAAPEQPAQQRKPAGPPAPERAVDADDLKALRPMIDQYRREQTQRDTERPIIYRGGLPGSGKRS